MNFTQADRPFRVKTPLGDDVLLLDSFQGEESISQPFHFVLKMLCLNPALDLKGLLKKPAVLTLALPDGSERHIRRISQLEYGEDGLIAYEAEIVPWLWFLSLFYDCRIFQNKNVQQIVDRSSRSAASPISDSTFKAPRRPGNTPYNIARPT